MPFAVSDWHSYEQQMHTEMFESITSMLLSCELAMAIPGVPAPAVEKIRLIDNLAHDMRGGWARIDSTRS
jgi:hypothetical protein